MSHVRHNFRRAKNCHGVYLTVPKEMDNFVVHNLPDDYDWLESNPEIVEKMLLDVAEGKTLREVCEEHAIPVSAILKRETRDKDFAALFASARRYRAEHYHDQLAKVADDVGEGNSKSAKVKSDIYKVLMAVGDRERFGEQRKNQDETKPLTIIFNTGIDRTELQAVGNVVVTPRTSLGKDGRIGLDWSGVPDEQSQQDRDGVCAEAPPEGTSPEAEEI